MLLSILLRVYRGCLEIEYLGTLLHPYRVDLKIVVDEIEFTHNTINVDFIMLLVTAMVLLFFINFDRALVSIDSNAMFLFNQRFKMIFY